MSIQPWRVVPPDSIGVPRVPTYLGYLRTASGFRLQGYHLLCRTFPGASANRPCVTLRSRNPRPQAAGFGLFRVRSPLLAESLLISLPPGTEMFHFPGCRFPHLCIQYGIVPHDRNEVAPFGNPRIKACLPLPEAYRSLPRPSSPSVAKASIMCPY